MSERVYRTALGISVGDILRVRYNMPGSRPDSMSDPYEVWDIYGPYYVSRSIGALFIRTWPVISLRCVLPGNKHPVEDHSANGFRYLGAIRQEGERWFDDQNAEIVMVQHGLAALPMQLFAEPAEQPYQFQEGVDYARDCWHCPQCGLDFNAPREDKWAPAVHCGWPADEVYLMEPRPTPPEREGRML